MFNKKIKLQIKSLENVVEEMMTEIASLKEDYNDYLEWRKMRDANRNASAQMGHFYISADDIAMLEKLIQECNKNENLAVLLTTAQGTTMSLRTYPVELNSKIKSAMNKFNKGEN